MAAPRAHSARGASASKSGSLRASVASTAAATGSMPLPALAGPACCRSNGAAAEGPIAHTWTTIETGIQVSGPLAVQEYVVALHANMSDLRTSQVLIGGTAAYLEGSCAGPTAHSTNGRDRVRYCVAYDLAGERICAMRAYGGALSQFTAAQPPT